MLSHQPIDSSPDEKSSGALRRLWHWFRPPTQAHRDRQSPAQRMAARLVLILSCAGGIGLAAWQAKPMHRALQSWRADGMCREAQILLAEGQVMVALQRVQDAIRMAPEHPEAARLNARILARGRRPEALYFFDLLERVGQLSDEDRVQRVRALVGLQRMDEAGRLLQQAFERMPVSNEMIDLALLVWPGQMGRVARQLDQRLQATGGAPTDALRLIRVEMASGEPALVRSGVNRAWNLAGSEDPKVSLVALELLEQCSELSASDSRRLAKALREHSLCSDGHWAASLRREVRLEPLRLQDIVGMARRRIQQQGLLKSEALVHWLLEPPQSQHALVLRLLDADDSSWSSRGLVESRLTALTAMQRFGELGKLVEDPRVVRHLSPATRSFYRAHLAFVSREDREQMGLALQTAVRVAQQEGRPDLLFKLAGYAEARQQPTVAVDAYRLLTRAAQFQKPAHDGLIRVLFAQGMLDELMEVGAKALELYPEETEYQRLLIYVNLLLGREVELGLDTSRRWQRRLPDEPHWVLLEILASWRLGDRDRVQSLLKGVDASRLAGTSGQRAVLALVAKDFELQQPLQQLLAGLRDPEVAEGMLQAERECLRRLSEH
jgi:tetratricopeptide (TPR) repeat protein